MAKALTGNKDLDMKIINELDDKELMKVCQANKYVNSLCKNDNFWRRRVLLKFGQYLGNSEEIKERYNVKNWEKYYKYLTKYLHKFLDGYGITYINRRFYMGGPIDEKDKDLLTLLKVKEDNSSLLVKYAKDVNIFKNLLENTDPNLISLLYIIDEPWEMNLDVAKYLVIERGMDPNMIFSIANDFDVDQFLLDTGRLNADNLRRLIDAILDDVSKERLEEVTRYLLKTLGK